MADRWGHRLRGHYLSWGRGASTVGVRAYEAGDEQRMTPRADFAADLIEQGGALPAGPRWTLAQGPMLREVLGIGGVEPLGGRRWGAWAYLSDMAPRQWLIAGKAAYAALFWARHELGRPTIQAVPAPTPQAVQLLKRIGFVGVGEAYMVWEG